MEPQRKSQSSRLERVKAFFQSMVDTVQKMFSKPAPDIAAPTSTAASVKEAAQTKPPNGKNTANISVKGKVSHLGGYVVALKEKNNKRKYKINQDAKI